jgi:tetratricopeptide (TPR) repeat protein
VNKEFRELEDAQDEKLELLKSHFLDKSELIKANSKVETEALDITRLIESISTNELDEVLDNYASKEGITKLEAKARVLQYLSPEWKNKVDKEVREFFVNNSPVDLICDDPENGFRILFTLRDEGYLGYLTLGIHFSEDVQKRDDVFVEYEDFLAETQKDWEVEKNISSQEKIDVMFAKDAFLPEARAEFDKLIKQTDGDITVDMFFRTWWFGQRIKDFSRKIFRSAKFTGESFDCDEKSLLNQKLGLMTDTNIHEYVASHDHVSISINGYDIVFDTYDEKFRTIFEFGARVGYVDKYGDSLPPSYFVQTKDGMLLTQYDKNGNVINYKKSKEDYSLARNVDIYRLLDEEVSDITDKAKNIFLSILEKNPNDLESLNELGIMFSKEGDLEKAKKYLLEALKYDSNYTKAYINLALVFQEEKNYTEAKKYCFQSLDIDPNYAEAYDRLGTLFFEEGDNIKAKKYLYKALKIAPHYAEAHNNLAVLFHRDDDFIEAKKYYLQALDIKPNDVTLLHNLVVLYHKLNDLVEIKQCYLKIIKINPKDVKTHFDLANLYYNESNFKEAKKHYLEVLRINPNHANASHNLVALLINSGRYDEAHNYLHQYKDILKPDDFQKLFNALKPHIK